MYITFAPQTGIASYAYEGGFRTAMTRPLNSHGITARLRVLGVISQSHSGSLVSHGLLSVSTTDLPSRFWDR